MATFIAFMSFLFLLVFLANEVILNTVHSWHFFATTPCVQVPCCHGDEYDDEWEGRDRCWAGEKRVVPHQPLDPIELGHVDLQGSRNSLHCQTLQRQFRRGVRWWVRRESVIWETKICMWWFHFWVSSKYSLVCYFGSKYLSLGPSCGHTNGCIKNFH